MCMCSTNIFQGCQNRRDATILCPNSCQHPSWCFDTSIRIDAGNFSIVIEGACQPPPSDTPPPFDGNCNFLVVTTLVTETFGHHNVWQLKKIGRYHVATECFSMATWYNDQIFLITTRLMTTKTNIILVAHKLNLGNSRVLLT